MDFTSERRKHCVGEVGAFGSAERKWKEREKKMESMAGRERYLEDCVLVSVFFFLIKKWILFYYLIKIK